MGIISWDFRVINRYLSNNNGDANWRIPSGVIKHSPLGNPHSQRVPPFPHHVESNPTIQRSKICGKEIVTLISISNYISMFIRYFKKSKIRVQLSNTFPISISNLISGHPSKPARWLGAHGPVLI